MTAAAINRATRRRDVWLALTPLAPALNHFSVYVPGFPGAHSQGETKEELRANLQEVVAMLLEDGDPPREAEFIGTETIRVA